MRDYAISRLDSELYSKSVCYLTEGSDVSENNI